MKFHVWLLFAFFLIAQIGSGAASFVSCKDGPAGHVKSCGMSCCKFVDGLEACGCMEAPASAPASSQPMQSAPSADRVPQPSMTATLLTDVAFSRDAIVFVAQACSPASSQRGSSSIGLPVLFCSFLI